MQRLPCTEHHYRGALPASPPTVARNERLSGCAGDAGRIKSAETLSDIGLGEELPRFSTGFKEV